jgi:hypothetical protein
VGDAVGLVLGDDIGDDVGLIVGVEVGLADGDVVVGESVGLNTASVQTCTHPAHTSNGITITHIAILSVLQDPSPLGTAKEAHCVTDSNQRKGCTRSHAHVDAFSLVHFDTSDMQLSWWCK